MTSRTPTPPSTRTSRRRQPKTTTMTTPTPPQTTRTARRRRPRFGTLPDGTRRRIRSPPPPHPTRIPISEPNLASLCLIWDFTKPTKEQIPSTYDRAEQLLYDTSTCPWDDDDERKSSLYCALHTAIRRVVDTLGFDWGGTTPSRDHVMAVYYHKESVAPEVPEWLKPLLLVETHSGFGYYRDFGEREYVELA